MDGERYKVVVGSASSHCCFEASVVDTTKPVLIGGKHYKDRYEAVCECMDCSDAAMIANVLNAEWARGEHERRLAASDDPQQTGG